MDGNDFSVRWRDVGSLLEVPRQGARVVATPGGDIAIFRTAGDAVFALDDRCPHKGGPLSQGIVHGGSVTCPLHNWVIDLATGRAAAPDEGCVRCIPVRLEKGRILLGLPEGARR
ncbi:MAG TPA: nitrite reductase small subunit NirD [Stellaceae bacterium]|nr:nitrite reductase small subunit NirD [Stellaceae bacterium]